MTPGSSTHGNPPLATSTPVNPRSLELADLPGTHEQVIREAFDFVYSAYQMTVKHTLERTRAGHPGIEQAVLVELLQSEMANLKELYGPGSQDFIQRRRESHAKSLRGIAPKNPP